MMVNKTKNGNYQRAGIRAGKEYPTCAANCGSERCIEVHLKKAKCPNYYKF